jgi:hypothetical protein
MNNFQDGDQKQKVGAKPFLTIGDNYHTKHMPSEIQEVSSFQEDDEFCNVKAVPKKIEDNRAPGKE